MLVLALFGFYRNAEQYDVSFLSPLSKFICVPEQKTEDSKDIITPEYLSSRYGKDSRIRVIPYQKEQHIEKCKRVYSKKFLSFYQQPYRIFSFFYHVRKVLEMIKEANVPEDTIIILSRIDIGLYFFNSDWNQISLYLSHILSFYDVILGCQNDTFGTDDKWFIFSKKTLPVFLSLYDDYEQYISEYVSGAPNHCVSTRPEDIFIHHFKRYHLKYVMTGHSILSYEFQHVCSNSAVIIKNKQKPNI